MKYIAFITVMLKAYEDVIISSLVRNGYTVGHCVIQSN
jgi:hypothetical protein